MTQKKQKTIYYLFTAFSLALTVFFIIIRKNAIEKYYDADAGFYMSDVFLPKLLNYGLIISVVVLALSYFLPKFTKSEPRLCPPSSFVVFASAFTGFVFFGYILRGIMPLFNNGNEPKLLEILTILLALPVAFHFFAKITADGRRSDKRAILGLAPVIWCIAYVFVLYFDRTILINNPHKILTQMTFIAATLFFLYECRFPLGKPKSALYLVFAFITQLLSGVLSVPNIIYFFNNGKPVAAQDESRTFADFLGTFRTGSPLVQEIIYDFLTLGIFLYVTARLLSSFNFKSKAVNGAAPVNGMPQGTAQAIDPMYTADSDVAGAEPDTDTSADDNSDNTGSENYAPDNSSDDINSNTGDADKTE